jgi:hypothetical protein
MKKDYRKRIKHPDGHFIIPEKEYRQILMQEAIFKGKECAIGLQQLFDKWDQLMRNCTNAEERQMMGKLAILEVSNFLDGGYLGYGGNVTINGEISKTSRDDKE